MMSLQLVMDKSVLQSLSHDESSQLSVYYYNVITPILFLEILADLAKYKTREETEKYVGILSSKLHSINSVVNGDALFLAKGDLLGFGVKMTGRPVVTDGEYFRDEEGKLGFILDQQPEVDALQDWDSGVFDPDYDALAKRWRTITNSINLEKLKSHLKHTKYIPKVTNLEDLKAATLEVADSPRLQMFFLARLVEKVALSKAQKADVQKRYRMGYQSIRDFAPYAFHCLFVDIAFCIALHSELITTRGTNVCDMTYLYYIPFCKVFASNDIQQLNLASALFGDEKDIVKGEFLKQDLQNIILHLNEMQALGQDPREKYGQYPPDGLDSLTYELWVKHFGPRPEKSTSLKMSPEAENKLVESIMKEFEYAKKHRG